MSDRYKIERKKINKNPKNINLLNSSGVPELLFFKSFIFKVLKYLSCHVLHQISYHVPYAYRLTFQLLDSDTHSSWYEILMYYIKTTYRLFF